jgi:hypothetical protein
MVNSTSTGDVFRLRKSSRYLYNNKKPWKHEYFGSGVLRFIKNGVVGFSKVSALGLTLKGVRSGVEYTRIQGLRGVPRGMKNSYVGAFGAAVSIATAVVKASGDTAISTVKSIFDDYTPEIGDSINGIVNIQDSLYGANRTPDFEYIEHESTVNELIDQFAQEGRDLPRDVQRERFIDDNMIYAHVLVDTAVLYMTYRDARNHLVFDRDVNRVQNDGSTMLGGIFNAYTRIMSVRTIQDSDEGVPRTDREMFEDYHHLAGRDPEENIPAAAYSLPVNRPVVAPNFAPHVLAHNPVSAGPEGIVQRVLHVIQEGKK